MKIERYKRISATFVVGESMIKDDGYISRALDDKLTMWAKGMEGIIPNFTYRVVNCETCYIAPSQSTPSFGYVIISLHIAYV